MIIADFPTRYQEAAKECFENSAAAVYDRESDTFTCETLLERGSCLRPNEHRILIPRPAPYNYWPSCQERCDDRNRYKLPFGNLNGACVRIGDSGPCRNNEVVRPSAQGFGTCGRERFRGEFNAIQAFDPEREISDFGGVGKVRMNCITNTRGNCAEIVTIVQVSAPIGWW